MSDDPTQEATQEAGQTPPAAGETEDPFSFFSADTIPDEHREAWSKGFDGIRSKYTDTQKALEAAKQKSDWYDQISNINGFDEFLSTDEVEDFQVLLDAWKASKAAPKPTPPHSTGIDPKEWADTRAAVEEFRQAKDLSQAQQQLASLVNTHKEAAELLKDPAIKARMIELTGPQHRWPLEAAYFSAADEKRRSLLLKQKEAKPPLEPEDKSTGTGKTQKQFSSVDAAFDDTARELGMNI